jgi:hypothetical protein
MQKLEQVFSIVKTYCQNAPSKGFVSFATISTEAGVSRAELKEHLEKLKKMKLITYSSVGNCYLLVTKLGMSTKSIAA